MKDAQDGLAYTAIFAGQHKNDLSPHEPLTAQGALTLQSEVNRLYDIFVTQVAGFRGMSSDAIRNTEASVYFGNNAVQTGLADATASFDQVLEEFASTLAIKRKPLRLSNTINSHQELPMTDATVDEPQVSPVDTDTSRFASTPRYADAQAIAELCMLAGVPQRTVEFLGSGMSEAQVRLSLLNARAAQPEITSRITADAAPEQNLMMSAIQRLNSKG